LLDLLLDELLDLGFQRSVRFVYASFV
jgi:hypothetical protein